ncbi:MAG: 16S rRNA processing protein RimM [Rhodobiaceae bacterium]|nr:16S rRNA processing protein RimM [Rhodobiaceae bacterium]
MNGEGGERIELGIITGARGIRGEVRLTSYAERPADIAAYGPLEDESGARRFVIRALTPAGKPGAGVFAARLEGVSDRNGAEALKGTRLFVARAALPEPEEESWYARDLVGLAVEDEGGTRIGTVGAVRDFGAGDLIDIRFDAPGRSELVPFTRAFVPRVDIAGGRIVVALPDDFFETAPEADDG